VSDQWCKLNPAGIAGRDELLKLLDLPSTASTVTNFLKIEGSRNLDRISTITPILNNQPVLYEGLRDFFVRAIEKVEYIYRNRHQDGLIIDEALCKKLNCQYLLKDRDSNKYFVRLREYFDYCCQNDTNGKHQWTIDDLYDSTSYNRPNKKTKLAQFNNKNTRRDDVNNLLCYLDYAKQEDDFLKAVGKLDRCLAFPVNTPCMTTQKWVVNRLIKRATYSQSDCLPPFYIDLVEQKVRNNYKEFIKYFSAHLRIDPDKILEEICNSNSLIILSIRGIGQFENIQKEILKELWEPLNLRLAGTGQSRIIMFWVDNWHPDYPYDGIVNLYKLAKLEEINQSDIDEWLYKYEYSHPFLQQLRYTNLGESNGDWRDPWLILDRICKALDVKDGIEEIKTLWT
jgi:hypothetical protein